MSDLLSTFASHEVLDLIPVGVLVVDAAGEIMFWNRGAERITGFSRDEARGKVCSFLQGWI